VASWLGHLSARSKIEINYKKPRFPLRRSGLFLYPLYWSLVGMCRLSGLRNFNYYTVVFVGGAVCVVH